MNRPDYLAQTGEVMTRQQRHDWIIARGVEAQRKLGDICSVRITDHPTMPNLILYEAWIEEHINLPPPGFAFIAVA